MPLKRKAETSLEEESSGTSSKRKPSDCIGGEDKPSSPHDKSSVPQDPGASINGDSIELLAKRFNDIAELLRSNLRYCQI